MKAMKTQDYKKLKRKQQQCAEELLTGRSSEAMKVATESAKRARLAQNKLFQEEKPVVYTKVF